MSQISIFCTSNNKQTSVIITDTTDWTELGVTRSTLSGISVQLFGSSLVTPESTYVFSPSQESAYIADGEVEILFTDLAGAVMLNDGWWTLKMSANSGTYISNYSGFGIYADITYAVWSLINSIHAPEEIKYDAERYCINAIFLKGLGYLDTTDVNSRDVKFTKRLLSMCFIFSNRFSSNYLH